MRHWWKSIWVLAVLTSGAEVQAQGWGGLLDRVGDRFSKTIEDRLSETSGKTVGKVFDGVDGTVDCVAGDAKCQGRADDDRLATTRCVATDVGCLKEAQARGAAVAIVEEEQLDTLRCSSSDTRCLKRAKKLGKTVQITD